MAKRRGLLSLCAVGIALMEFLSVLDVAILLPRGQTRGTGVALRALRPGADSDEMRFLLLTGPTPDQLAAQAGGVDADKRHGVPPTPPPDFTVPVEVRDAPQYGEGQRGIFALARISRGTVCHRKWGPVPKVHHGSLPAILKAISASDAQQYLRRGCVNPMDPDHLIIDFDSAACFVNHSRKPNLDSGGRAIRDILPEEELLMNYRCHAEPAWYQELCADYDVLTERQIAALF
ncbi:unnamed protein product [Polarella glacialis]|uniref:SET domain-containing protein n=1 Tax=Polarella glacialis TaxID=89957 RepID=A0A813DEF2_POLGL|nr:unnamed protein product [Polarella glacialis]